MLTPANHLDFSMILPLFPNLLEVRLCFQVKKCGIDFRWNMFGMTEKDADNLASGLGSCAKLTKLSLRNSKLTDTLLYDVLGGMDKLGNVVVLDFPNNVLTDECIDVLTKSMANKKIQDLNLSNNKISNEGAKNLAVFIAGGKSCLKDINLSLNLIEDDGAVPLLKAVSLNRAVVGLGLSSNRLGAATCRAVRDLLTLSHALVRMDLSCNQLGEEGGALLLEGLRSNTTMRQLDIRLTGVAKQVDIAVEAVLHKNSGFK
jgi:Ran GTPase-activating protein (RanGAP) involved in mRNA processing and transport